MSEGQETIAISGRDMVEYRRIALELAVKTIGDKPVAHIGHIGGQFLALLMNLQPIGVESVIVPSSPENAGAPKAPTQRKKTTLAAVTSTETQASAPAAVGSAAAIAAGTPAATAPTAQSAGVAGSSPSLVSAPVSLTEAAAVLKQAVADPQRGREFVKTLLAKYEVEIMSQIPAPKLADFVRDLKGGAPNAQPDANDPLKGLI